MSNPAARICVPVCVPRTSDLTTAIDHAARVADIVELRLDCLADSELPSAIATLPALLKRNGIPKIVTLRPAEQGGHKTFDLESRRRLWLSLQGLSKECFIDLELDLVLDLAEHPAGAEANWSQVICSHHDFERVPIDLQSIYQRMAATPARVLKIAVRAHDVTDCLPIFQLLDRAEREGRELIAIAMGPSGIMTRILGPSRGSFLTYGSIDDQGATAPGQLTGADLRDVFRLKQIDRQTKIMGLIGNPVRHSFSPLIHNAAFAAGKVNAVYVPFEVIDAVSFIRRMADPHSSEFAWNLRGLSVTAPHKSIVMQCLDWIDSAARDIGAVNTIVIQEGKMRGYNTDAAAFLNPLRRQFGSLKGARCGVVGAGGSARAALWALSREGASMSLFVRDPARAKSLADEFKIEAHPLSSASFAGYDILINATPLGTRGDLERETAICGEQFRGVRLAYDLVYNPLETKFMREARAAGCETLGGIEMFLAQAVAQFELWTGNPPDVEVMRSAALRALREVPSALK